MAHSRQPPSMISRILCLLLLGVGLSTAADGNDHRQGDLKDLNGYFPFDPPADLAAWKSRSADVRRQLEVSLGLYPLPEKKPLNAVKHGRKDMGDYSVEKGYFESFPGFFVTGSLFWPKQVNGKVPAVLCPHGHWPNGRFMDIGEAAAKKQIESGAEEFINAGRNPLQARCVQLARMGCVVFHYDMLGYADSLQISMELAHKFAAQKAATPGGFFTAAAEGQLQSILGLQSWNGIRALDFVCSLPEVDQQRIGVTGASGGGTQTFLLCALDPRPAVAFPAVMVSTAMQGGCTCENASLLRIGTGNVEIAALFAPKPQGMTAADDWTKEMPTKGFPQLKKLYELFGAGDQVALTPLTQFPHNYNRPSRVAMEQWFAKHLKLGEAPAEKDFTFLTAADLTVWDATHPAPQSGPVAEREVLKQWTEASKVDAQIQKEGWRVIIGRDLASTGDAKWDLNGEKIDAGTYFSMKGEVQNSTHHEVVKVTFLYPKNWKQQVAVWLSGKGADGLFGPDGKPVAEVAKLLEQGWAVAGPTLFQQDGKDASINRRVPNPREAPSYTYGYNSPLFAKRIHDVLSVLKMIKTNPDYSTKKLAICAGAGAGKFAAVAGAIAGDAITASAYETEGFTFASVTDVYAADFLPGAVKYGDVPALEKLQAHKVAPQELLK